MQFVVSIPYTIRKNQVEDVQDEIHFLIECVYYEEIRLIFLNQISIMKKKEDIMDKNA